MNGQYSWKRTEDIEIDLENLLYRLCLQWKEIVACALVFTIVLGGYGYLKSNNASEETVPDMEEETMMTEQEKAEVAAAVRLQSEIREMEVYLDNSILMQLDASHKNKVIMLYCIEHAKRQELPKIAESYLSFILNGGAADALGELDDSSWKMDKCYMAELISAYQKIYSFPYQIVVDSLADNSMLSEILFYVEITGKDGGVAEEMAQDMQKVLEQYAARVKESVGSHKLTLVSSMKNEITDSGLLSQQRDKKTQLSSNRANLKAMTDAFSRKQIAVYQEESGLTDEIDNEQSEEDESDENSRLGIKYIVLGFLGGVFAYGCIYSCWYLFCDKVKSTKEMKDLYTFPVYGEMLMKEKRRKNGRAVPETWRNADVSGKAQVLNRIRLACNKQGMVKLCAVSDYIYSVQEKECLESIAEQLKSWGIHMTVIENAIQDITVWDDLTEVRNVLMVCRLGITTHRMIDEAMNFYLENDIAVTGAIAFVQNG